MNNKAFETIVELINSQLSVLDQKGYKIFDGENEGYFIQRVRYDKEDDCIKFDTEKQ